MTPKGGIDTHESERSSGTPPRARSETFWRDRVRPLWEAVEWPLVGLLALLALGLGIDGFRQHLEASGQSHSASDVLYRTLQLFVLESGWDSRGVNWELGVARLLAPAVAAYAAVRALGAIFREQLHLLRVRSWGNHVVICGLGRKGVLLAEAFRARKERVAVIEKDEENSAVRRCRDQGIPVVIGDATDLAVLRKAGVQKAKCLISVCGEDGVNADVAAHAQELVAAKPRRSGFLRSFVHVVDLELCTLLRDRVAVAGKRHSFRLELFNVFESGARGWLNEHLPFESAGREDGRPHLLVVGAGQMGKSLIVGAARRWLTLHAGAGPRPRITIVDREAERRKDSLLLRHPQLEQVCELVPVRTDVTWPEFEEGRFLFDAEGRCDVTTIYVCLDDDVRGLAAGLDLLQRVREHGVTIVVRTAEKAGLAAALGSERPGGDGLELLHAFPLLDLTCTPEQLLGETPSERLARTIHEDYVQREREKGETVETNPSIVEWDELPESLRESNRRQADHLGAKLKAVGCGSAPLTGSEAEPIAFSPEEVELLAELEHKRWMAERLFEGWTHAPGPKNLERKTSPALVAWEELPETEKEKDRATAGQLPACLARASFQVYRLEEGAVR